MKVANSLIPARPDDSSEVQHAEETLGRITGLAGSRIMVTSQNHTNSDTAVRVGSMVVVRGKESDVVGVVDSMELDAASFQRRVAITPLGEITHSQKKGATFHRGVSHPPALGAFVVPATSADLKSRVRTAVDLQR